MHNTILNFKEGYETEVIEKVIVHFFLVESKYILDLLVMEVYSFSSWFQGWRKRTSSEWG